MATGTTVLETGLEHLKHAISPEEIAYYSEGGALGTRAMGICSIINTVRDADVLRALLAHSKTLHAPRGKEFPIKKVQDAITRRIVELAISTSQNG